MSGRIRKGCRRDRIDNETVQIKKCASSLTIRKTGQEEVVRSFFPVRPFYSFFSDKLSLQLVLMQVGDIFYRCIVIDTGNFAVVPGIGFVNDFSVTDIYCHMADRAAAIFIKNQISRL